MANNYQIDAENISENRTILVQGKAIFTRISRVIEGQNLAISDRRRVERGMRPIGRPHTEITIANVNVRYGDPQNPTLEEQYIQERLYIPKNHPERGLSYSITNKSDRLPQVFKRTADGQRYEQVNPLLGELAEDVPVTLVLRTYKPNGYEKRGVALDKVLIEESEVRYYNNSGLEDLGIVFAGPTVPQQASTAPVPASAVENPAVPSQGQAGHLASQPVQHRQNQGFGDMPSVIVPNPQAAQANIPAPVFEETPQPQTQPAQPVQVNQQQPAAQETTIEELQRQLAAAQQSATAAQQGGQSAFQAPVAAPAANQNPWNNGAQPGIAFNG